MRIRWAPAAADDLQALRDYLKTNHPAFLKSTIRKRYKRRVRSNGFPIAVALDAKKALVSLSWRRCRM